MAFSFSYKMFKSKVMKKKTLILGASTNPARYSFLAAQRLANAGHPIVPVGIKKGVVAGEEILKPPAYIEAIDTITLYLNPKRQEEYYDYIIEKIKPKRIIFNPGTENHKLSQMAREQGIETLNACTLVMLASDTY
jgi:predicted CoA-binding protein